MQHSIGEDLTCEPCSASKTHHSPPATHATSAEQISADSTFYILQLNANGIGKKLTELVLEKNKVNVAVIMYRSQSSHQNPRIPTSRIIPMCKDRPHGRGGKLLIFIYRSITLSKQSSSPESLSDPHLKELTIKADIGNTKLIISNIYIPPASSCSNG